jgi:hypothetical protein
MRPLGRRVSALDKASVVVVVVGSVPVVELVGKEVTTGRVVLVAVVVLDSTPVVDDVVDETGKEVSAPETAVLVEPSPPQLITVGKASTTRRTETASKPVLDRSQECR